MGQLSSIGWLRCGMAWAATLLAVAMATAAQAAAYDFAYRLSGDKRVAPVQVFDDGNTTWLQFQPGQTLPAIFAIQGDASSETLTAYDRQGPYLVLPGTASGLVLRIGDISARADYVGKSVRTGLREAPPQRSSQWLDGIVPVQPDAIAEPAAPAAVVGASLRSEVVSTAAQSTPMPVPALEFDASPTDANMRTVLARWSSQAGWMFGPEHWTVEVDIPLIGAASFGADFRHAVRSLLGATELADHPLQPCFYSNRVLRVVPLSQACDRTVTPVGNSVARS